MLRIISLGLPVPPKAVARRSPGVEGSMIPVRVSDRCRKVPSREGRANLVGGVCS